MDEEELDHQRELNKVMIIEHSLNFKLKDLVINLYNRNDITNERKKRISKLIVAKILNYRKELKYFKSKNNIY